MMKEIDKLHNAFEDNPTTPTSEPDEPDDQDLVPEPAEPGPITFGPSHKYNSRSKILNVADADAMSIDFSSY